MGLFSFGAALGFFPFTGFSAAGFWISPVAPITKSNGNGNDSKRKKCFSKVVIDTEAVFGICKRSALRAVWDTEL